MSDTRPTPTAPDEAPPAAPSAQASADVSPPVNAAAGASDASPSAADAPAIAAADEDAGADGPDADPDSSPQVVEDQPAWAKAPWVRWLPLAIAAAVPFLLFFVLPPLTKSGLWDPYELNVADLSRRIALNLFHAGSLSLSGAENGLPHLNDLGRPQLPFSSVAVGFTLFGLHEWAGRLPLAIWGLLGVLATYASTARLFDKRTGVYASIALSTMPLYLVEARSILGDVCTMAGVAMAFGGLAVATVDRDPVSGRATSLRRRAPWLVLGVLGLFVGFESRGGLIGLGIPLLGVGLAWGVTRGGFAAWRRDTIGSVIGAVSLVAGLLVAAAAARAMASDEHDLDMWIGTVFHTPAKYPTFDFYVGAIGHALAPWSAFLPFAFGRLMLAPRITLAASMDPLRAPHAPPYRHDDRDPPEDPAVTEALKAAGERESFGRTVVLVGSAVAFTVHAFLVARTDLVAFSGPALCAVACAVAIRDFERGAHASIAVGLGTLVLAAVIHHDFHEMPEKAYEAFGIASASFPEGFKNKALGLWWAVLGGFALCAFFTWVERDAKRSPFDPKNYARVLRGLLEACDGIVALVYFAVVAGTSLAAAAVWLGTKTHGAWLPSMSSTLRDVVLNAWWAVALFPLGLVFGLLFACDVWLWAFGRSRPLSIASLTRGFEPFEQLMDRLQPDEGRAPLDRYDWWVAVLLVAPLLLLAIPLIAFVGWHEVAGLKPYIAVLLAIPCGIAFFLVMGIVGDALRHRAPALALGGALVGAILCLSYYPALANQLSPKEVFESYAHTCTGSPLGLLGVGGRTAAYYAGGQPQTLSDPTAAFQWLMAGGGQRRCLALKAEELPKLNELWRERAEPRTNLPVLDARSSQILLASSSLESQKNDNPLSSIVLSAAPNPQRKVDANLDDKLEVLGFDLLDERYRAVDAVSPGRTYHVKTYYRVLAPITTEWEAFIHIDGYHRRHNGDHKPLNGKYPMTMWLPGDLLVDDHEFKLEPNFSPGTYGLYFGLFAGDTRIKVKSGPNDGDNRVNGGSLRVQ